MSFTAKNAINRISLLLCLLWMSFSSIAQTVISGTVKDRDNGKPLTGMNVFVAGSNDAVITDNKGQFNISSYEKTPFVLVVSGIGFDTDSIQVNGESSGMEIKVTQASVQLGEAIVVAAKRIPERILESPVSIERMGTANIRQAAAANYYDAIAQLKGMDIVTASLLFSSPSTRGFSTSGNVGFNQFIDGMDNSAPGLNFSLANMAGVTELDIANIELLPGTSSALYGSGGINGTLFLNSKDPFIYQGLSVQEKTGVMHIGDNESDATIYQQYEARYAKAFNNKFAFKVNASYTKAHDWVAGDYRNYDPVSGIIKTGDRNSDPGYDGINMYGDEVSVNMTEVAQGMLAAGLLTPQQAAAVPSQMVSRTGYKEKDIVDYNTNNTKLSGMVKYKITENTSISAQANWGSITSVYTGVDRYSLKDVKIGQYKLELNTKHLMLRAYTTQENAGDAYNANVTAQLINEGWKPSPQWFGEYVGAYLGGKGAGFNDAQAFQAARVFADNGRPEAGSDKYNQLLDQVTHKPIPSGSKFIDKSSLYNYEGMYDFSHLLNKVIDVQAGANYRRYWLKSEGTLFADTAQKLTIDQVGMFVQASKKLFDDHLKLTGAIRYDKIENFEGKWTPRIAAVYTVAKDHNIRASYQTGYRLPTTQEQYIDLNVSRAQLIGGIQSIRDKYNLVNGSATPAFLLENVQQYGAALQQQIAKNIAAGQSPATAQANAVAATEKELKPYEFKKLKPQSIESYELGYRGIIEKKLMLDVFAYYSKYTNFIGGTTMLQPKVAGPFLGPQLVTTGASNVYVATVNLDDKSVTAYGWGIGGEYSLPEHFVLTSNVSYNKLDNTQTGFRTGFNTPEYRFNIGLGNDRLFKNFGAMLNYRYQSDFTWESSFGVGQIPSISTVDAQVNYRIPDIRMQIKLGGTNLFNKYYSNALGNPAIGALYYISLGYNVF